MLFRQHFNVHKVQMYVPGSDLRRTVGEEVLCSDRIITCWERIVQDIPQKYEQYTIELLKAITDLRITIRGHSFAKGWTMKFERKYQKGIRKSLLPENKK